MLVHEAHTNFDIFVVIADEGEHLLTLLSHFEDLYVLQMWSENVFSQGLCELSRMIRASCCSRGAKSGGATGATY